eukprot:Gb_30055 [translate_table: standard]
MNNEPNMYPSNRTSMLAATNMQGYINSANAASHAGSIYAHDLMAAAASSAEHVTVQACANEDKMINNWNLGSSMPSTLRFDGLQLMDTNVLPSENSIGNNLNYGLVSDGIPYNTSQALAGGFCPHPILRSGSEVERIPSTGSGVRGSAESNFGRANHFTSGGRGSCKRKSMEYISGHSSYDGPLQSFNRDGGSSSRFTVPLRHDIGSSSRFPTPAVTPGGVRYWEESAIPRPSLMSGASMNSDYRCSSVSMTGAVDGSQRSVRSRPNTSHHHEPNLRHLQPSGNSGWYLHPRSLSSVEQPASADLAGASTSSILREPSQFPVPSSFQRRGLIPDGWNENMPRVGSHFSSTVSGREWPSSLHDETSSNSMIVGDPNQVWPVAGSQNRVLNNDLAIWTPMNRNMNGIAHTAQMCGNLMLNQRTTVPWHRPQNSLMQATRTNSGTAQGSISASRPGQSNHFPRQAGPVRFGPLMDMALHPAGGFQGSHYLRSSLLEHRGEQDVRPHVRSILDVSFERLQTLPNDGAGHNRLMPELLHWEKPYVESACQMSLLGFPEISVLVIDSLCNYLRCVSPLRVGRERFDNIVNVHETNSLWDFF